MNIVSGPHKWPENTTRAVISFILENQNFKGVVVEKIES